MTTDQFKQARNALGFSVNEMADALGISSRTIRRYEAGTWEITKITALAIEALQTRKFMLENNNG